MQLKDVPDEKLAEVLAHCSAVSFMSRHGKDLCQAMYPIFLHGRKGYKKMSRKHLLETISDFEGRVVTDEDDPDDLLEVTGW